MENQPKSKRGGARPGAGRPRKSATPRAASFEAADPTAPNRPRVLLASMESKKELTPSTRLALLRLGRWSRNNHGFCARIVTGVPRYALGNGMPPQARTSDAAWNKAAEIAFEDQCGTDAFAFDKSGAVNFYEAQRLICEQMCTDGDFFAQLDTSANDRAMVRFIGGEYVGDPAIAAKDDGFRDGVLTNSDGRPVKYRVLTAPGSKNYKDVPAEDIIHFRRLHRWGYTRGVSWLCQSVQRFAEWRRMLDDEQASASLGAKVALSITSPDSEFSLGSEITETRSASGTVIRTDSLTDGSGVVRLDPGERIEATNFGRPNQNFEPWLNFLAREISWGVGLSPEILWAIAGIGGANTRYVLQDAETFFNEIRQLIEYQFCRRFWRYWVWHEIRAGRLSYPGDDWWRVEFTPPQRITVDFGRDSKIYMEAMRTGSLSRKRYFNMLGLDEESEDDDIIRGYARRKKRVAEISAEEGVPLTPDEIFPA